MPKVKIPSPLRRHTNGAAQIEVPGERVREAFDHLQARYPDLRDRVFDGNGEVRSHLIVFLNNEDIRFLGGLDTPLKDGDSLVLLPALAGG